MASFVYPHTPTVDQIDDYHGVKVADPYRWLEDADSPQTKDWITAENALTFDYLDAIPERETLRQRLTTLWNFERYGLPSRKGDRYFYQRNSGLQNQSVLYVADGLNAEPRVLIDPNTLSADGTVALMGTSVSDDGKFLAYALADAGSDWTIWYVRNIETGEDLPDIVRWSKFSGASWSGDGAGFFYTRYDEPKAGAALQETNFNQKVFFHRLGDDQSQDTLIYARPDHPDWYFGPRVTDDGRYLVIHASQGTEHKNRLFYKDLTDPAAEVTVLLPDDDASYGFIGNDGPLFYIATDKDAPNSRVIAIDIRHPEPAAWKEIVKETGDAMGGVRLFGDQLITNYLKDAKTALLVYDKRDGSLIREIALPGIGSAGGFGGKQTDTETFYYFTSYTTPSQIYRYNIATGESVLFKKPEVAFDGDLYETEQLFYQSKDGTRVPMFVTHKKGMALDGTNPTLLYAYGGFNASLTPGFSMTVAVWLEMGGVFVVANLRGGGEYGERWHDAGKKRNKQNVFDDFIAAAEHLIKAGYTSSEKLAINGGSNGGLLVGAVLEQRPDLFGAAIPEVGVMDMIRFPRFTVGWGWQSDYGSPDDPEEFKALYAYSPYHNTKPGTRYPATLIMTSDHDDRVVPAHSFKFAAALQAAQAPDGPPVLIRIETRAGHGAGKPVSKSIQEYADKYGFLVKNLGISLPEGFGKP